MDGTERPTAAQPVGHRSQARPSPLPPPQLLDIAEKVDARLQAVLDEQSDHWRSVDPRLGEAVDELARIVTSGGKRLRAAFCYWAWRGSGGPDHPAALANELDPEELVINMGAAFEFLQVFALIHDDIMDDSATRRGATTVHVNHAERLAEQGWRGEPRRYGEGVAILVGDLGHVYADQLTAGISDRAKQLWDELRIELNLGQYLDMRSAAAGALDIETARRVATFKSALYTIVRPLQVGSCLHGAGDAALMEQLDQFGRPLGRAFQLRDDALGVLGDESQLGKPVGDDLREGKPTELVAYAMANADAGQTEILSAIGVHDLSADQIGELVEVLRQTGAVEQNEVEISRLVAESTKVLAELPFTDESRDALQALADYVAARTT
ncbi:MAG: polyprenyl synthetase family protein [Acidimicrobiales bacterium]